MAWKKGESGNPNGRPQKKCGLTDILEKVGNQKRDVNNMPLAQKQILANLLWEAATTGSVTFPGGTDSKVLDQQEWVGVVKFIYQHIDGPPKTELEHSGSLDLNIAKGYATVTPDDWDADKTNSNL